MNCSGGDWCYSTNKCSDITNQMESLTFILHNTSYTIPPEGYTFPIVSLFAKCLIPISPIADSSGLAILGDSFLRNFISSYNFKSNKISFGVNPSQTVPASISKSLSTLAIVTIIIGFLALITLIVYAIKYNKNKKTKTA